jgi:putative ABC transport system substrate-binding protein
MSTRRAFITLLGGAAAWPLAARAQQPERVRRIGVLSYAAASDPEGQIRVTAFTDGLQQLGWNVGRNVQLDARWAAGKPDNYRKFAAELVALGPDVILAVTTLAVAALQQASRTVPIVFVQVIDPVSAGFVVSMSRPDSNATGFTVFEYGISAKWLELLKEIAPRTTRVAIVRDPNTASQAGLLGGIQAVAPSLGVELRPIGGHDAGVLRRAIPEFARDANGGMIVLSGGSALRNRDLIIMLAARHQLPAVYSDRVFVNGGGLISYGPDRADQYRRAASYVDRILKGEKPADLPVQAPTKYELVINLKTAKALGIEMPASVLARSDEVIE